jgi:hypothetical protein
MLSTMKLSIVFGTNCSKIKILSHIDSTILAYRKLKAQNCRLNSGFFMRKIQYSTSIMLDCSEQSKDWPVLELVRQLVTVQHPNIGVSCVGLSITTQGLTA